MAQLYGEARTGIVGGQMNLAFEAMAEAGRTIVEDGTALTKAGYLAAAEKDPAQHKALANVEQQNAIKLAASVDAFLERCRPTAYGAGAAYRPGAYAVLRPVFAPLLRRVGASTPSAAATAATDVLAAIRWCFEHAQELQLKEAGYEPQPAEHRREGGSEHE
jgi:ABC-type phosphate transport system substrate-binding protein